MRRGNDREVQLICEVLDADDPDTLELPPEYAGDLRFQAELARYRRVRRSLRSLQGVRHDPGPELLEAIMLALDAEADRSGIRSVLTPRRAAYLGGLAAATAAGVGSAIVLARRHRRFAA